MIIPFLRTSSIVSKLSNPDLTDGAITARPFGPCYPTHPRVDFTTRSLTILDTIRHALVSLFRFFKLFIDATPHYGYDSHIPRN